MQQRLCQRRTVCGRDRFLGLLLLHVQVAGLSRITVGGEHERWEIPRMDEGDDDVGDESDYLTPGRPKQQHGQAPKVCSSVCSAHCSACLVSGVVMRGLGWCQAPKVCARVYCTLQQLLSCFWGCDV